MTAYERLMRLHRIEELAVLRRMVADTSWRQAAQELGRSLSWLQRRVRTLEKSVG